ncbi:TPA: NapC/NirT family cytochrome c [Vibrio harveyi]|nr:NapC/NirT family cytochrome c [Vibrio harveyi]
MKIIEQIKQVKRSVKLAIVAVGIGIGLISALPATEVLHVFSTNEFCASCHTMKPMAETFSQSIHGGNNQHGFVADCIDCHLPKSNIVEELWVKGTSGTRHLWGEFVLGMESLDYDELHPKRGEYVYDSGCINCHRGLEERAQGADENSPASDFSHNLAFNNKANDPSWKCSSCHYDIAHPSLKREMRLRDEERIRNLAATEGL